LDGAYGAGNRRTNRSGRFEEAVGHGAVGGAIPAGIMMAAIALRLRENVHFDRLLAAVRLRHRAAADIGAGLEIGERRLQHGGDLHVIGKLERDRAAVASFRVDGIAVDPLDRARQPRGLPALLLGISGGYCQCGGKGTGGQNACPTHVATSSRKGITSIQDAQPRRKVSGARCPAHANARK